MNETLRAHADTIIREAIRAVLPDEAVRRALEDWQIRAIADNFGLNVTPGILKPPCEA